VGLSGVDNDIAQPPPESGLRKRMITQLGVHSHSGVQDISSKSLSYISYHTPRTLGIHNHLELEKSAWNCCRMRMHSHIQTPEFKNKSMTEHSLWRLENEVQNLDFFGE